MKFLPVRLHFFLCSCLLMVAHVVMHAQRDLDLLDDWVREMHPAPFIRCGEQAWLDQLKSSKSAWKSASEGEKVRIVNSLLQVLEDSHTAISPYDWIWDVEKRHGTLPVRWAIEGRSLWVLDSGLPGLPEDSRVLKLNGLDAEDIVEAALDLSSTEGPRGTGCERSAAHNVTSWVLQSTSSDSLEVTWLDPETNLPATDTFQTFPLRKARRAWRSISTWRPVVDWTFPDGSHLTKRDNRRIGRDEERVEEVGLERRTTTHFSQAATLKISSFSSGSWRQYYRRLDAGFEELEKWGCPLILDLRANAGGQSQRMEAVWNHIAMHPHHLPYALVAKQSRFTQKIYSKYYRRLRKRWVDKHLGTSREAKYTYDMATLPVGETDTLFFPIQRVKRGSYRGPLAVLIDGESASASVSLAGAIQSTGRGTLIGEPCMGPANGTMGNPYIRILPESGIVVSISTAVFMAMPCSNWGETKCIQPDVHVPSMWHSDRRFDRAVQSWIHNQ